MNVPSFVEFYRVFLSAVLSEGDYNDRMAKGPYRELLPPSVHSVDGDAMPSAGNLPSWAATARREGIKLVSVGGADNLPSSKSNDETRPPTVKDAGASAKLTPVKTTSVK